MRMLISVVVITLIAPLTASAQEHFTTGVLGASWGSTLQEVKAKHPKGFAWHGVSRTSESIVYQVVGQYFVPGINTPVRMVEFHFTMQNRLHSVALRFDPEDVDAALYDAASLLGQDYAMKDEPIERMFYWKPNRVSAAAFSLGLGEQHPWAHLHIVAHRIRESSAR